MGHVRVLVTGGGSVVGRGIMKSLRIGNIPATIISADIDSMNPAFFRADESLVIPKVEDPHSFETMIRLFKEKRVDVVMIGSEFDIEFFAEHRQRLHEITGAVVIVSPAETVRIAGDKWLTAEFLREHQLPYAQAYLPKGCEDALTTAEDWGFPVILKPRVGTSSRNVYVVHSADEMVRFYPQIARPMLQRLIGEPRHYLDREYTCSIFKCRDGTILGPFTSRRVLGHGYSKIVEVNRHEELHELLMGIGKALEIMGPFNVQLMMGPEGPVPFELNARFSSTSAIRAHFGFNEAEMALRHFYAGQALDPPLIRKGMAFRYEEEVFLDGVLAQDIREDLHTGEIRQWF